MLTKDAEAHFGGRRGIRKALGNRTRSAIHQWGDVVPLISATELERLSGGELKVNRALYDQYGRIDSKNAAA